jgi:putative ABC transport system ATP-binding protein
VTTNQTTNILELQKVTRVYGSGRTQVTAVDRVNLTVEPGEIVLIMGPSGSGKTTMLSMAGGLLKPTSGEVIVAGSRLSRLKPAGLTRLRLYQVGFVFQAFNLLAGLTAQENVAVVMNLAGRRDTSVESDSRELLERLGLGDRLGHVPADLSGGEKQRVAVARALANDPPLLLADEPTGNLDSRSGKEVMMLLNDLARESGKAVVIVTHDSRIMGIADRILWLEDGELSQRPREENTIVEDPVCGRQLPLDKAVYSVRGEGEDFYFCSSECRQRFLADPQTFTPQQ